METLLSIIAIWLSVNFGLPGDAPRPHVEFHSEQTISRLWVDGVARENGADHSMLVHEAEQRAILAFYDDELRTIFLTEDWDPASPKDLSILVHEMVHHLQNLDARQFACHGEREKLAYKAQDEWLRLFRTSLEDQFEIDPFTLLLSTKCMH